MELDDLDVPMMSEDFTFEESDVLTDEQLAYIKSAAESEQDAQPENVSSLKEQKEKKEKKEQAEMMVAMGLDFIESKLGLLNKELESYQWDDTQKAISVKAIAPMLVKSRGELPDWVKEWVLPYKEELTAFGAVAGLGFSLWLAIKNGSSQPKQEEQTPEEEIFKDAA